MLRDPDLRMRFTAWRSLEKFGSNLSNLGILTSDSPSRQRGEALLTTALYASDVESRMAEIVVMGMDCQGRHVRLIRRALKDTSVAVRRQAACILSRYPEHNRSARLALASALSDEDDVTRLLVEYALGQIRVPEP